MPFSLTESDVAVLKGLLKDGRTQQEQQKTHYHISKRVEKHAKLEEKIISLENRLSELGDKI